jgi:hypothetical protein
MHLSDLLNALILTHLPFFAAAVLFLAFVRRMRRPLEQIADRLERRSRGKGR